MLAKLLIAIVIAYPFYAAVDLIRWSRPRDSGRQQGTWTLYLFCTLLIGNVCMTTAEWFLVGRGIPNVSSLIGLVLLAAKIGLLAWSRASLGKSYQIHAGITDHHELVRSGPYRYVRHPIYLARYLGALGMPLILNSFYTLAFIALAEIVAIRVRIGVEEGRLLEEFGSEYSAYRRDVGSLLPTRVLFGIGRAEREAL